MFSGQQPNSETRNGKVENRPSSELDLESLYYNFHQCTGSSRQEFEDLTLGEVQNIIITYVNINGKQKNKNKNESKTIKGEKVTYMKL